MFASVSEMRFECLVGHSKGVIDMFVVRLMNFHHVWQLFKTSTAVILPS